MQDQRIGEPQEEDRLSAIDCERAVLNLLLGERLPWKLDEIVREMSCTRLDVIDAVAGLECSGLVHRLGDFVFPTRSARRAEEIGIE